jgi:hypothetical protein
MELLPVRETTGVAAFYSIKNAMLELGTNQFHFNGIFARTAGSHQVCASRLGESCVKLVTSRWRDPAIPPWAPVIVVWVGHRLISPSCEVG